MTKGEFIIHKLFKTFFPDLEYTVTPEITHKYLYNVCISNIIDLKFCTIKYIPVYISTKNKTYSDEDFIGVFKGFAPNLNGQVLVHHESKFKPNLKSIIVTPNMTIKENYGLIARITDPYFDRFPNLKNNYLDSNFLK